MAYIMIGSLMVPVVSRQITNLLPHPVVVGVLIQLVADSMTVHNVNLLML